MAVTVFLRGGLGNQLFQYATGLYLSRKQDEPLSLRHDLLPDSWDSILGVFRCPVQLDSFKFEGSLWCKNSQPIGKTHLLSKFLQLQRMLADRLPNLFLRLGILAGEVRNPLDFLSERPIRIVNAYCSSSWPALMLGEQLRTQIEEIVNPSPIFVELSEQARLTRPIVVHIRLGDYLRLSDLYGSTDYAAIWSEISRINHSKKAAVWLFTDSPSDLPEGMADRLGVSRVIGPETIESPLENLVLMSSGSHLVAANSTFSWWAAFLKGEGNHVSFPDSSNSVHSIFSDEMVLKGWRSYGCN
jgi:hypothetical protein